jgi:hypothetical protein
MGLFEQQKPRPHQLSRSGKLAVKQKRVPLTEEKRKVPKPTRRVDDQPADPVVTRLLLDIQLACRSRYKVARGLLEPDALDDANDLERGAFIHLANYLDAKAWVRTKPDDM